MRETTYTIFYLNSNGTKSVMALGLTIEEAYALIDHNDWDYDKIEIKEEN